MSPFTRRTVPETHPRTAVAVIGMAGRFPGARTVEEFWENLKSGKESITFFGEEELREAGVPPEMLQNPAYVRAKGHLADADCFDADFFACPPREAETMDPQLRLLHECCWEALEAAGYNPADCPQPTGAYFGANENLGWLQGVASGGSPADEYDAYLLNQRDYTATRISYKLGLEGPSFTLLSACSTSLTAIHLACQALQTGDCRMALAGGVSLSLPDKSGYIHQEGFMFSSDGHCRSFSDRADGTIFGDGVGVVVLKRLEDARRDGDHIHAVIRGSALSNDGGDKVGFTAPSVEGQARAVRAALHSAGVTAEEIGYVEAHGTATKLGDPIEVRALTRAFASPRRGFCGLGSVKSNIGHLNIAAGVAAFIKTVLALEHRFLPPTLHSGTPNPALELENSPFYLVHTARRWKKGAGPRRAGVSAFGFGGTNAHVILEEAPRRRQPATGRRHHLLPLSGRDEQAVREQAARLAEFLARHPDTPLAGAAYTLAVGRKHFPCRASVTAADAAAAAAALARPLTVRQAGKSAPRVAFLFPGQGAQFVGMGAELYRSEPGFRRRFDECAAILRPLLEHDLHDVVYPRDPGPQAAAALTRTAAAQPAIFTVSYALAGLLQEWGITPAVLLGHSLGEFVAACLAGVFTLSDALHMVARRGLMMEGLPPGAMLAVPLAEAEVLPLLSPEIALAAVNGPQLCVLSGATAAIEELRRRLQEQRVATQRLATSHAFHSHLVEPIMAEFSRLNAAVPRQAPLLPILSTVSGDWATAEEITRPEYWTRNLRGTVRFSAALQRLLRETECIPLEVGPGRSLGNLVRMHLPPRGERQPLAVLPPDNEGRDQPAAPAAALGRLWECGVEVDWAAVHNPRPPRLPLPTYPFARRRFRPRRSAPAADASTWSRLTKKPDLAEWFHLPSWKRSALAPLPPGPAPQRLNWLVFAADDELTRAVTRLLEEHDQQAVVLRAGVEYHRDDARSFTLNPARREDYERLFAELDADGLLPRRVVHLWPLAGDDAPPQDAAGMEAVQNRGFYSLLCLAQMIGAHNITDELRLTVVSPGLHDVLGGEAVRPENAPVLGPVKVIPQEYPQITCCCIDPGEAAAVGADVGRLAGWILTETVANAGEPVVAYRNGHRWVQVYEKIRLEALPPTPLLRPGGVYLITGGLGGIGLVLAEHLARTRQARLVLTARTPLPPPAQWPEWRRSHDETDPTSVKIRRIEAMQAAGAEVLVCAADVADHPAMAAVLARAREHFGVVHGVIHAAGLPGEGIIQLKRPESAREILTPKIQGTVVLEELLQEDPPDFLLLCSSIAAVLGGIGLADYSAANAYLDACAARRSPQRPWLTLAVDWDMWGEVGMGLKTRMPDELQPWLEKELRDGITSREGVEVFERLLAWGRPGSVVVSTRDLQHRIDLWIKKEFVRQKESLLEAEDERPKYQRPTLEAPFAAPETAAEQKLAAIWEKLFGFAPVGRHDNFYELGGHSLLATTLVNKLKKDFSAALSIRDIMDHPTLAELAALLEPAAAETPTEGA